ncbi:MAG: molybdopterin-dependent oxidoreductase [Lachnospiraceae bacterium]|nr:molybdopterin-dependent oxidoreductase [Lachnospiraceae bacterium]
MAQFMEKMLNAQFSRRQFLKGSAAATAAVAGLSLAGCGDSTLNESTAESTKAPESTKTPETTAPVEHSPIINPEEGGTWVSAACWHNCAGRCVNKVMVKDGMVVRQKTDDNHEDSWEYQQQRACVRGRAQQQQCFGNDRLKYPMKRKNWQPGGGDKTNGHLRGVDEWERITWDEAFKYVADEIKRVYAAYGPGSCMARTGDCSKHILALMGGYTSYADTTSYGTYCLNVNKLGLPAYDLNKANDRMDLKNSDTIVFYGGNPAWASAGSRTWNFMQAKKSGKTQFVVVGPSFNATASTFDAKWIRVRPGTDTAFLLGVAYEMLALDKAQGGIVDWDFLNKYTVGFDKDHMPEGAKLNENFQDYVLGAYDDIPKTAEWASKICGTPVEDIKWYANEMRKDKAVSILHSYAHARNRNAEDIPQLFMTIGCMGGHYGKPGHSCGAMYASAAGNSGPNLVKAGGAGLPAAPGNACDLRLNGPTMWQSILTGKANNNADYYSAKYNAADIRDVNVKMMYWDGDARLQTSPDLTNGIKVMRQLEFVCTNAQFLTTQAKYADVVMPVTTLWERVGGFLTGNRESLFVWTKVTEPLYEAKDDVDICRGILKAMGMEEEADKLWPISKEQQFYNQIAGCTVINEAGDAYETLVTITQADIDEMGVEGKPQEGKIGLKQFLADGCYTVPRKEGDNYGFIGYKDFIDDPEGHPLSSDSGKFEIYNDWKADILNSMGYSPAGTFKPYPTYTVAPEGYETTFKDGIIGGEPSEYPFLCYNPHYLRRSHSVFDNCPWLRETWPNPVFLNKADAEAKGIKTGDTVKVYNAHGAILRTASLTNIIMPGCVGVPHGSWLNYDDKNQVDRGGADNVLCGPVISGMGVTGYNNYNCNFELYDGEPLAPDVENTMTQITL